MNGKVEESLQKQVNGHDIDLVIEADKFGNQQKAIVDVHVSNGESPVVCVLHVFSTM